MLRWVKGATPTSNKYKYKNAFATRFAALGSTFTPPRSGLGIGLNNSAVVLDAAKIYNPLNEPIVGTAPNSIMFSQQGTTKNGKLTINPGISATLVANSTIR